MKKLQRLDRQRSRIQKVINLLEVGLKESLHFDSMDINKTLEQNQQRSLKALKEDFKRIENQLVDIIHCDPKLTRLFKLITSVAGVGACSLISNPTKQNSTPDIAELYLYKTNLVSKGREEKLLKKQING